MWLVTALTNTALFRRLFYKTYKALLLIQADLLSQNWEPKSDFSKEIL